MRRLPWPLTLRADRKAVLTAMGVAIGVAFSIVSFAVPLALQTLAVSPVGPLAHPDSLVHHANGARFDPALLAGENASFASLSRVVTADGTTLTLVAITGERAPVVPTGHARAGGPSAIVAGVLDVAAPSPARLTLDPPVSDALVIPAWFVVAPETFKQVADLDPGTSADYAIVHDLSAPRADALRGLGMQIDRVPGIDPFFQVSAQEVSRDLLLVVAFSCVLVVLFISEFLRSEVREKRAQIGIWRALGMRSTDVVWLLVARAAFVTLGGIALGVGLAVIVLNAAQRAVPGSVFSAPIGTATGIFLLAAFVVAGTLGGVPSAVWASRMSVRDAMEDTE